MATTLTQTGPVLGNLMTTLRSAFTGIGNALVMYGEVRGRVGKMEAMNAKSDAELAAMGLKREDIARFVFRDQLFL